MVAEKNSVWRCFGSSATILLDVADEAHVEHAVGFVEHEDGSTLVEPHMTLLMRSSRRPGVATRMSTPLRQRA